MSKAYIVTPPINFTLRVFIMCLEVALLYVLRLILEWMNVSFAKLIRLNSAVWFSHVTHELKFST